MRRKLTTLFIVLAYLLVAGMVAAAQQAAQGGGQAGAPQGTAGQARPAGMGGGAPPPPFRLMYNCTVIWEVKTEIPDQVGLRPAGKLDSR